MAATVERTTGSFHTRRRYRALSRENSPQVPDKQISQRFSARCLRFRPPCSGSRCEPGSPLRAHLPSRFLGGFPVTLCPAALLCGSHSRSDCCGPLSSSSTVCNRGRGRWNAENLTQVGFQCRDSLLDSDGPVKLFK